MPVMFYLKITVLAIAVGACAYFYYDYQSAKQDVVTLRVENAAAIDRIKNTETRLINTIEEHNKSYGALKDKFHSEREQRMLMEQNYQVANERIADIMSKAEEEKQKYETGRLTRLAAVKGGLITRLAKKGATKRNTDWEALAQ